MVLPGHQLREVAGSLSARKSSSRTFTGAPEAEAEAEVSALSLPKASSKSETVASVVLSGIFPRRIVDGNKDKVFSAKP